MSRRQITKGGAAARRRPRRSIPVILYLLWPIWGPIVRSVKQKKAAKKKAETVTKADLATMAKAVKTGKLDELEEVARHIQRRSFRYRNRHVVDAAYVAAALAASKLLVMAPSILPLAGLLIFGALLVKAPAWLRAVGRSPLPELKTATLDRIPADWPGWVRPVGALLCSPLAGACFVVLFGVWWWAAPLGWVVGFWTWFVVTSVTLSVRAWRFQVRTFDVVTLSTGTREEDWATYIAGKGGVGDAKGSVLQGTADFLGPKDQRLGWSGGVVLPKGSAGASVVAPQLRARIATTYSEPGRPVGAEDVMIERFRSEDGRPDESRFVVTVLDEGGSNAVYVKHLYQGATFDPVTGIWRQGWRADWKPALVQLYDKDGSYSIHFSGSTGAGKSEGLITMMHNITSAGVVAPYIIDIGAATFGDWRDRVEVFVDDIEDAAQILVNAGALREYRKRKRGKMRRIVDGRDVGQMKVYPVARETPIIPGVFDEWSFALEHPDFGKAIEEASEAHVTQQRKEEMPLIVAGQATSLQYGFKNNSNIRTQFQAGAMVAYRNNNDSGRQAFGGLIQVDPSTIPPGMAGKGVCFVVSNVDQRDAMARAELVDTPVDFYGEVDIPQMPSDEIDILTRGLSFRKTIIAVSGLAEVEAPKIPLARTPESKLPPARPEEPEELAPALVVEIANWVEEQDEPVQRIKIVEEFQRRKIAARTVDAALKQAKRLDLLAATNGRYEVVKEEAA